MATPVRKNILDALVDLFEDITVANGYKTTLATVARTVKDWGTWGAQEAPALGMKPGKEAFTYEPGQLLVKLPIELGVYLVATSDTERSTKLNNVLDDVIAALESDPTLGVAGVIETNILGGETDEGDPDTADSRGGSGFLVINIEVVYLRSPARS